MNKTCYCCDAIGTTKEHVPPSSFFPKGMKLNYVPSCETHNTGKSNVDEQLRFILASTSTNVPKNVLERTVRGIVRHVINGSTTLNKYGLSRSGDTVNIPHEVNVDLDLICDGMKNIAQGIYYYENDCLKKLTGNLRVFPIFLRISDAFTPAFKDQLEAIACHTEQDMKKQKMIGDHPDIFLYQIIENKDIITINMLFYKEKVVSVMAKKLNINK